VEIFLATFIKGLVMGVYSAITGKEMFPANPKGPLYKWFGKANHGSSPEKPPSLSHDQPVAQLESPPVQPPLPLPRASERRR
jgi:hypothetical protein